MSEITDYNPYHEPGGSTAGGRFASAPGAGEGTHPGHGYSAKARLVKGVIHTSNVDDAVRALYENKKVELNQPRQVSTLIDKLGDISKRMIDSGGKAPNFNLCNVSVKGSNLFCAESKGIPRIQMPQLEGTKDFRKYLRKAGYSLEKGEERADYLRSTQNELNAAKVARNAARLQATGGNGERIIVSKDNYILDGHHRWAAQVGLDAKDNKFDTKMRVVRANVGITKLLEEANKFTKGKGRKGFGDAKKERTMSRAERWRAFAQTVADRGGFGDAWSEAARAAAIEARRARAAYAQQATAQLEKAMSRKTRSRKSEREGAEATSSLEKAMSRKTPSRRGEREGREATRSLERAFRS